MFPEGENNSSQINSSVEGVAARAARIGDLPENGNPIPENWPADMAPPEGTTKSEAEQHYYDWVEKVDSGEIDFDGSDDTKKSDSPELPE